MIFENHILTMHLCMSNELKSIFCPVLTEKIRTKNLTLIENFLVVGIDAPTAVCPKVKLRS